MELFYSAFNNIRSYYNAINPNTLSGAIDVVVVEQPDGSYLSTPFHVRFGKWAVFNVEDKYVDIQINNRYVNNVKMKLGDNGICFFVEEMDEDEELPDYLLSSPIPRNSDNEQDETKKNDGVKKKFTKKTTKTGAASKHKKTHQRNKSIFDPSSSKQSLPFSSSIFSCRKYRSLPDLRFFDQHECQEDVKCDTNKPNLNHLDLNVQQNDKPITHSKSTIISKEIEVFNKQSADQGFKRKHKSSESSESDGEAKQKPEKSSALPPRAVYDDVADGALSDSEVDRKRFENHTDDKEWKWGEYPDSKGKKDAKSDLKGNDKSKKSGSAWNWFGWRSSQAPREEEGVYLGDLVNKDPNQLGKYFGTSSTSQVSNVDSGNGCSTEASPSSPSAMSMESLVEENVEEVVSDPNASELVEEEAPTPQEIDVALEKADIVEKQMLADTDEKGEVATSTFKEEVQKNFDKQRDPSHSDLPSKTRSMSGTSIISDISIEDGIYTTIDNGRPIRYKRTLRLKSDQLKDLQLQYGSNNARFSISTKIQGTAWSACHIYLLRHDERVVISDIDGTITKSDVLGHIIPAIGGTWAHTNIVDLYRRIQNNGYRIIYLSSRAIGQSYQTKKYLSSVIQDSKTLPDGPVLLSPTSVLMAFRKEVIERKPEEFKIACLTDLMSLFPAKHPFYAGFGNRETDIKSYVAVGIPPQRILIIDPAGKVENAAKIGFETNYDTMLKDNVVDHLFPPVSMARGLNGGRSHSNSFNYWRNSHDLEDMDVEKYEKRT